MHIALRAALACGLAHSAIAADIHVQPGQSIQAAIVSAQSGDRILVHPGTYAEAIDLLTKDLVIESVGGAAVTTIDATGLNTSVVRTDGGQTSSPKLIGLTLTGGSGSIAPSGLFGGGGVLVGASGGSPFTVQIHSCVITNNHVGAGFGGGVLGGGSCGSVNLNTCVVSHNVASERGGGAYEANKVTKTIFEGNRAADGGGYFGSGLTRTPSFTPGPASEPQATFINNTATNEGGGAYVTATVSMGFPAYDQTVFFHQCVFRGNSALVGGGVRATVTSTFGQWNAFVVTSCVFSNNSATLGDGIHATVVGTLPVFCHIDWTSFDGDGVSGSFTQLTRSIVRNVVNPFQGAPNLLYVALSNVAGWPTSPSGNIDADPMWVNPAVGDYRLQPGSPCVDSAGLASYAPGFPQSYDYLGSLRTQHAQADMGADEFDHDCDGDGNLDHAELAAGTDTDCDGDLIPDSCQPLVDCNGNGIRDSCEITSGTAPDCNHNKIVDSCEALPDCDGDGISNLCEIQSQMDGDCNSNGIPDSCDIANGTALDLDRNGVPDSCHGIRAVPSQYATIQMAINVAASGDTILVADGTYSGPGFVNLDFKGKSILVTSASGPLRCILIGSQAPIAVFDAANDSASLRGFTLRNGSAGAGGAILISKGAHPKIEQCVFLANSATYGGAIDVLGTSSATIRRCLFVDNSAVFGGAVTVQGNGSAVLIEHSTFVGNSTVSGLGAGGAVALAGNSSITVRDSVLWNNSSTTGSQAAVLAGGSAVLSIDRSIIDSGLAGISVSNGQSLVWGPNNLTLDPQFVDLAARDLHLTHTSPCRDAGSIAWAKDLEGDAQVGAPDIGADEFAPHAYTIGEASPGQSITLNVIGAPGSTPVFELFGTTLLAPPAPTPFGSLFAGPPFIGAGPFVLPQMPSSGVIGNVIAIPASTPVGLTFYRQVVLGAPEATLTNLDVITIVP
jgi:hypothetical protein